MEDIKNYSRPALEKWFTDQGMRAFRAGQIFKWIYLRQADDFSDMTDLGKALRLKLSSAFHNPRLEIERTRMSKDGTEKILFRLSDGNRIESVLIPQKDHYTLCVSSQAGCRQGCRFCLTATGGFQRNLTCAEMISQVRDAGKHLVESGITAPLSNIVFMGMGEPLDNYDELIKALSIITDSDFGLKFSPRRVTVSTCGLVPEILRLGKDSEVNLAVSLNAVEDAVRSRLMPVNNRYPMTELLAACRDFHMKPRNKITFEYILIKGVNDSDEDALRLVKRLRPIRSKVNVIPFNPHEGSRFQRPSPEDVSRFLQILLDRQITAIIRKSKGDDISAACGQLKAMAEEDRR